MGHMTTVFVLNGPNLNLLGTREPQIYGSTTLADVEKLCRQTAASLALDVDFRQSNHEGELIDWIHEAGRRADEGSVLGVVLNPGAYTHTSIALHDAIAGVNVPVIECHISNVHARESFRHHSYVSSVARAVILGFGVAGYPLAIEGLHRIARPT
jgi:3-dehydroquinate dehydratase-2